MVIAQLGKAIIACCEAHGRATDPFGERGGATRIGELLTRPRLGLATSSSSSARAHRARASCCCPARLSAAAARLDDVVRDGPPERREGDTYSPAEVAEEAKQLCRAPNWHVR